MALCAMPERCYRSALCGRLIGIAAAYNTSPSSAYADATSPQGEAYLCLVDEEHADGAGAAVAGDGAPGGGDEDFPEGLEAVHRVKRRL